MPTTPADVDILYYQLQRRLVESGEWDRIKFTLGSKLTEIGWSDDVRHRSKEHARGMDPLSFRVLLKEFTAHTQTSLPLAVKREVMALIRHYVDQQFE
ncbi:hypothetical protein BDZ94DRAFT_1174335 [Collybia nuda]|uniref:Transcription and mRNA export factor SUS1 n=1 Tax=Collybia nuda TaxID=64659 RepID=A0A9P5XYK3_9AGAR|nr:hypothetical protein BDZ94DRAFT_1174335 [Collybia nuda]